MKINNIHEKYGAEGAVISHGIPYQTQK